MRRQQIEDGKTRAGIELGLSMDLEGRFGRGREDRWIMGVPFEFVGQIASSRSVAEASDIESCTTSSRHD